MRPFDGVYAAVERMLDTPMANVGFTPSRIPINPVAGNVHHHGRRGKMQQSFRRFHPRREIAVMALAGASLVAGLTFLAGPESLAANPKPFKFMNIHFEINASGCDMGIQILFDTDGVTDLTVEDPNDVVVFSSQALPGMEDTHDQTEGFQERVEPRSFWEPRFAQGLEAVI